MLIDLCMGCKVTRHFRYRTAQAQNRFLEVSYEWKDAIDQFRKLLAEAVGSQPDNHEVYEVTTREGSKLYFWFSDWRLMVGTSVLVENW